MNLAFRVIEIARDMPRVGLWRRRPDWPHVGHFRRAFTLLEVVIVLVLVVILSGLAYNALMRPMAARRLQLAADQIRAEWIRARNRAMANGQTYCFQCELGGNGYMLVAYDASSYSTGSTEGLFDSGTGVQGSSDVPLMQITAGEEQRKELPERITFADAQVDGMEQMAAFTEDPTALTTPLTPMDSLDGSSILFFPDGTTSSALITLENEYGRRIDVSLRGLTGAVLVSDLYDAEGSGMTEMPVGPAVAGSQ